MHSIRPEPEDKENRAAAGASSHATAGAAAPTTTIRQPLHSTSHNNQRQHPQQVLQKGAQKEAAAVNLSFSCAPRRLDMVGGHDENGNDHCSNTLSSSSPASSRRDSFLFPDLDDVTSSACPPRQSLSASSSPVRQRGRAHQLSEYDASLAFRATSAGLLSEGRHRGGSSASSSTAHKPSSSTTTSTSTPPSKERPPVQAFRQEKILVEWLNFALCPPDGSQSVRRPGEFLKRQDDEIKAQVQAIYDSTEMVHVQHAIKMEIGRKRLQVREDRDLHMDLSLREAFLELLLSYQLPWLQVGLEVLLGTEIATARYVKARDGQLIRVPALSVVKKLIVTHILSDPIIVKAYSGRPSPKVREAMKVELRAHTVERFLSLVVLLDQAKRMEILPRRRPLFKATAGIKSSAAMLHTFAKEYMAGEGNLARHLLGLGYGVEIQQQYLEEFDFRTTALSRDLRDGVRLVRLVEVLTAAGDKDREAALSSLLRVPAISRLQKVHNVKLALEALRACGLHQDQAQPQREQHHHAGRLGGASGLGRLCPDDIVDGHREKTLGLLWAIVRHFQLDYVVSSLTDITRMQSLIRARLTRRRFLAIKHLALILQRLYRARRALLRCHTFPAAGAVALQSAWRGMRDRRFVAVLRAEQLQTTAAAAVIVAAWKGYRVRAEMQQQQCGAVVIQAAHRRYRVQREYLELRKATVHVQALVRGSLVRRQLVLVRTTAAATLLAANWKGYRVRVEMQQRQCNVVIIQAAYRRCRVQRDYLEQKEATVCMQALVRRGQVRRQLAQRHQAAAALQRQQILAATLIASVWKGHRARAEMQQQQRKTIVIQAAYRRCRVQRAFGELRRATVYAQALARGGQVRWHLAQQQRAANTLQRHWRARQARKTFCAQVGAVVLVQRLVRGYWARREYQQQRDALFVLQVAFRGYLLRKHLLIEKEAATVVQTFWRTQREQRRWRKLCVGVVGLQALSRGNASRSVARWRLELIAALQKLCRGFLCRRLLEKQRTAAGKVQAAWRGHHARWRWALAVRGVVRCQALLRGQHARQEARLRWYSLLLLQRVVRRFLDGSRREKVAAVVHLQRLWRGYALRTQLAVWAHAAIRLQSLYRSSKARHQFLSIRLAVIQLQALVRCHQAHHRYQACLVGVRALQHRVRQRRWERALHAHLAAVVTVQSAWRGFRVRQAQCRTLMAARCLQAWVRAGRARQQMRRFRRAVLLAQAVVRGWLVRRVSLPKVRVLRVRVREATARAEADPSLRIGVRHAAALEVLLSGKSCAQLLRSCLTLVVSTSLARECCEALVEVEGVPKLLAVIRSCNRSTPHMELLRHVLRVLVYVTAHPSLLPALAETPGAVETFTELLQTYRPDDHTFIPAAKLLLSACESECGVQARADLHHPNVQRRLQGSLRLLERKAEVEKKSNSRTTTTTRLPKAGGKEVGLAGPIRVLRSILAIPAGGTVGNA